MTIPTDSINASSNAQKERTIRENPNKKELLMKRRNDIIRIEESESDGR